MTLKHTIKFGKNYISPVTRVLDNGIFRGARTTASANAFVFNWAEYVCNRIVCLFPNRFIMIKL